MRTQLVLALSALTLMPHCEQGLASSPPDIPTKPQSQQDCKDWGRNYQAYFDAVIAKSRSTDEQCKRTYKGEIKATTTYCPNTSVGRVEYRSPCGDAEMWTECQWLGFFNGMRACLGKIGKGSNPKPAESEGYELDDNDVSFLRDLAKRDEFVHQLSDSAVAAEVLGIVVKRFAVGPVKLAVKWDLALIDGWKKANNSLKGLNKYATCDLLADHYLTTKAPEYFDNLSKVRGCQGR